jgi:preprotein translocase subunit SecA
MSTETATGPSVAERAYYSLQRARGIAVETDLRSYRNFIGKVRATNLRDVPDTELTEMGRRERGAGHGDTAQRFALVSEALRRVLGLEPYDEQLIAGYAMYQGKLAQMQTGEGKTLAAVFPACIRGWSGAGVHVLTANDYLARRDAEWMGPVYRLLSVSVAHIDAHSTEAERRGAYACDVTYLTVKEGGFDLLRDELSRDVTRLVRRGFACAIIDEADFILIDEARTPLVIAGSQHDDDIDPYVADRIARALVSGRDVTVDRCGRRCGLTASGVSRVERQLGYRTGPESSGMEYQSAMASVHVALHAHLLLHRDVDYIVRAGRVELVDEATGRIALDRRRPYGIQRALEVKEGVNPRTDGRVRGTITIHGYVSLYPQLSAMTATAVPVAAELCHQFGLATVVIPPHRTDRTMHYPDRVFTTHAAKKAALLSEIEEAHATGRPILIGTGTIAESRELAATLERRGVACRVLNASQNEREAELIARAGMLGSVTVATNMAGRGTDIKLGGASAAERRRVLSTGGLYVIGTRRHESVRTDNQLRGRAGRQGDPGSSRFFVSLEDDLVQRYAIRELLPPAYRPESGVLPDREITDRRVSRELERAQTIIQEQHATMRRTLRSYSAVVENQRLARYEIRQSALCDAVLPIEVERASESRLGQWRDRGLSARGRHLLIQVFLKHLDEFWADHLALVETTREGIHLQRLGKRDPLLVYLEQVSASFDTGLLAAYDSAVAAFEALPIAAFDPNQGPGCVAPGGTWTYTVGDDPLPAFRLSLVLPADAVGAVGSAAVSAVRFLVVEPAKRVRALLRRLISRGG